jgi:hypothetical protein
LTVSGTGSIANITTAGTVAIGSTTTGAGTITTTSTATADLVKIPQQPGRAIELIVKGSDTAGNRYRTSTLMVMCGASGTVDYTEYGVILIGSTPGAVTVTSTDTGANVSIQVTAASANSTVWATQYRYI